MRECNTNMENELTLQKDMEVGMVMHALRMDAYPTSIYSCQNMLSYQNRFFVFLVDFFGLQNYRIVSA